MNLSRRYPPWCGQPVDMRVISIRASGVDAARLADKIRAAWAKSGHDITPEIVRTSPDGARLTEFAVRLPQLRNGLMVTA